jgi:hypothetical protein
VPKRQSLDFNWADGVRADPAVEQEGEILTVGSEKLLPEADQQKWSKYGRDQSEKGMGEYFFVDPS